MGFSREEYWSGLSFPSPGNLPSPEVEPRYQDTAGYRYQDTVCRYQDTLPADSLPSEQGIYELLMFYSRNLPKQRRGRRGLAITSEGSRDSTDVLKSWECSRKDEELSGEHRLPQCLSW